MSDTSSSPSPSPKPKLEPKRLLFKAITNGDVIEIEGIAKDLVTFRMEDKSTLLHLSAANGPVEFTKILLEKGLDPNVQTIADGSTALHLASVTGRVPTVETLLQAPDIDDTIQDFNHRTPIQCASSKAVETAFRYARSKFVDRKVNALHVAVLGNDPLALSDIVNSNRAKLLVNVNTPDPAGNTILHKAVKRGNENMVKACISIGADPFAKDRKGKLPMEMTNSEEVKKLLRAAPMICSPELAVEDRQVGMAGYLHKYVNFARGYKRRYVVLDEGVLSYYKSKNDYPVACKGSLDVHFARLVCPPGDKLSFELRTNSNSLFFKAENEADAKRWRIALGLWQSKINGSGCAINAANNLRTRSASMDLGQEQFKETILAAQECVSQLETLFGKLEQTDQSNSSGAPQLLVSLKAFLRLCGEREEYWQGRLEVETRQKEMVEETVRAMIKQNKQAQLINNGSEMGRDEFYDALDEIEAMSEISITTESEIEIETTSVTELASNMSREIIPEKLEKLRIPERAIPAEDIKFVEKSLLGYSQLRRDRLPSDSTSIPPLSIWNIVKNAIGKDLTRIPVPVNFSEPISMLQRLSEDLEYADLLYMASTSQESLMRLQYAAAFAVSPYSSTDGRTSKPFNPILGETFEYVSSEHGFRYISEQVSHHPPISACYCETSRYNYYAEVLVKTKFWGKSMELVPEGVNHIQLKTTNEHISYRKVNTGVYNIIMGKIWLDHYGSMRINNHSSGEYVELEFKPTGWRTSDPKKVEGFAYTANGLPVYRLEGYWNKYLRTVHLQSGEEIELWRRRPMPPWSDKMYNFTYLTMTLNEFPPSLSSIVCSTDSRLRPDQRAMEDGYFEDANEIKVSLEEKQRAIRKSWEETGFKYEPKWFTREVDQDTGEQYWKYNGGYWEQREEGVWGQVRNLYLSDDDSSNDSLPTGTSNSEEKSDY